MKISKLLSLVLFVAFINSTIYAQDYVEYNTHIKKAKLHKRENYKDLEQYYQARFEQYDSAMKSISTLGYYSDYYWLCYYAVKIGDTASFKKYFYELAEHGIAYRWAKPDFPMKDEFFKSREFRKCKREYKKRVREVAKKRDKKYMAAVSKILKDDQKYRGRKYKKKRAKQSKLDTLNLQRMYDLFKKEGAPSFKNLGYYKSICLGPVFHHMKPEDVLTFSNILFKAYKNGEYQDLNGILVFMDNASWRYGTIFDFNGEEFFIDTTIKKSYGSGCFHKQSFGTMDFWISEEKIKLLLPIYNKERANEIRKRLGLSTIEEQLLIDNRLRNDEELFLKMAGEYQDDPNID